MQTPPPRSPPGSGPRPGPLPEPLLSGSPRFRFTLHQSFPTQGREGSARRVSWFTAPPCWEPPGRPPSPGPPGTRLPRRQPASVSQASPALSCPRTTAPAVPTARRACPRASPGPSAPLDLRGQLGLAQPFLLSPPLCRRGRAGLGNPERTQPESTLHQSSPLPAPLPYSQAFLSSGPFCSSESPVEDGAAAATGAPAWLAGTNGPAEASHLDRPLPGQHWPGHPSRGSSQTQILSMPFKPVQTVGAQ